jgi:glutathione S-transferase
MSDLIPDNILRQQQAFVNSCELNSGEENHYRLWQNYASPYSQKVMAYLNYKGIPYKRINVNVESMMSEIAERVGKPVIPVIITPDDQVMQDSTPMLEWFEGHYSQKPAIPDDNRLAFLMWLLEEFSDEYLRRIHLYTRWSNELNSSAISHRLARTLTYGMPGVESSELAPFFRERQTGFYNDLGLSDRRVHQSVETQLHDLLSILEAHFQHFQFLLGFSPSIADFAFYGSLKGHLFNDPNSAHILEVHAPRTCQWLDTLSELGDSRGCVGQEAFGDWINLDKDIPDTLKELLAMVGKTYIPFALASALAAQKGDETFQAKIYGQSASFSTHPYRVWSFEQLQIRYQSLTERDKEQVQTLLTEANVLPDMMAGDIYHNGLFDGFTPPFIQGGVCDAEIKRQKQQASSPSVTEVTV